GLVNNELFICTEMYETYKRIYGVPKIGDMLVTGVGTLGKAYVVSNDHEFYFKDGNIILFKVSGKVRSDFLKQLYLTPLITKQIEDASAGTTVGTYTISGAKKTTIPMPPLAEQEAIAEALSDADALIESLEQLIAKKRHIKQGTMQELLTGKKRLADCTGKWEVEMLQEVTDCLDHLRVPLNDVQRAKMKGDYSYCGANGVLDFVNSYVIDDDIILIAEDGGYFDEYAYRPIAYRMVGKCWVNNHAHILKSKTGYDQGFIFYSLVHKNILQYLASGTRPKLNKSEMNKIEVRLPANQAEQSAIATILSDMDTEITALEKKLAKARQLKQVMMQELLTGRIRLV
ncbi:MAG: restriction endonuclease subunit S, partial [Methylococcales bacterium]